MSLQHHTPKQFICRLRGVEQIQNNGRNGGYLLLTSHKGHIRLLTITSDKWVYTLDST